MVTGNNPVLWELVVGAAFTVAPTYADVNTTYSSTEYGTGGTFANLTNGIVLMSGHIASNNSTKDAIERHVSLRHPVALNRAGAVTALGTLSLLVTGIGGTSATRSLIEFDEIR